MQTFQTIAQLKWMLWTNEFSRDIRLKYEFQVDILYSLGGNRTMVAAATIVSMAAAKKAQQNVFALYHSYNRTILLGFIWILDFHFKIVLVLRRHYLVPTRCNNGKKKNVALTMVAPFWFQHWRWLHALISRAGNFWHTHNLSTANKYVYRLYDCWRWRSPALTPSWPYNKHCGDIGNRHSMQVTHSYKERIFHLFPPQLKTNLWMLWHHKLKLSLSAIYI